LFGYLEHYFPRSNMVLSPKGCRTTADQVQPYDKGSALFSCFGENQIPAREVVGILFGGFFWRQTTEV